MRTLCLLLFLCVWSVLKAQDQLCPPCNTDPNNANIPLPGGHGSYGDGRRYIYYSIDETTFPNQTVPTDFAQAVGQAVGDWNAEATCYYLQLVGYPESPDIYIGNTSSQNVFCGQNTGVLGQYPHGVYINYTNASTQGVWGMASILKHELGHSFGLLNADVGCRALSSIMVGYIQNTVCKTVGGAITQADVNKANQNCANKTSCDRNGGSPNDDETWSCPEDNGCDAYYGGSNPVANPDPCEYTDSGGYWDGCPSGYSYLQQQGGEMCCQPDWSPIIIDVSGNGFALTDPQHGVLFDLDGSGTKHQFSWTAAGTENGWLALDRNGNGVIDSGMEMFGNFTTQPTSSQRNGFAALAVYDEKDKGGNQNGEIDPGDAIFRSLLVWIDRNHNGVPEPQELYKLADLGIEAISLEYRPSKWTDQYGNAFRYRAHVKIRNVPGDRWTYDVFLRRTH